MFLKESPVASSISLCISHSLTAMAESNERAEGRTAVLGGLGHKVLTLGPPILCRISRWGPQAPWPSQEMNKLIGNKKHIEHRRTHVMAIYGSCEGHGVTPGRRGGMGHGATPGRGRGGCGPSPRNTERIHKQMHIKYINTYIKYMNTYINNTQTHTIYKTHIWAYQHMSKPQGF